MTLVRLAIALLALAAVLFLLVRFLEPRFAFFPLRGETTTPRELGLDYQPLTIETSDGERLRAWLMPHRQPRAFVVYFHGNGGHLSMWAPIVAAIARQGYTVLALDYRGYGMSSGRPSERGLYRDVDAVLEHLRTTIKPSPPVVYWGRSLGAAMAAYAATRQPTAGVILESGFPDARSLFRAPSPMALLAFFSTYRFPTVEYLREAKVPALVMHGDADSIVPYELGRALYERIDGPKQFFTIRGGDHNDPTPTDPHAYWQAVDGFIGGLARGGLSALP